ncbi:MAG: hypothetical protein EOL87_18555 [Spartobacteria bacterium]|nr:hypothetical protein [Spartobacteria bacterium]
MFIEGYCGMLTHFCHAGHLSLAVTLLFEFAKQGVCPVFAKT